MAAAMSLLGHITGNIKLYAMDEQLLVLPKEDMLEDIFKTISNLPSDIHLGGLEGCYLYFDTKKKWVRSGKTSGDGEGACFTGRGSKHAKNARSIDEMKNHPFYRTYPAKRVKNIGGTGGYFQNLSYTVEWHLTR